MILVIENEDLVRANILELLEAEGFNALGAMNGREGISLAERASPSLVICDILMPDITGYEVLATLRHHPQFLTTPFVFLSAKASEIDTQRGLAMGANRYLTKPFTAEQLLGAIHHCLQHWPQPAD